ncbi:hypothetical protein C8T65DRAFT_709474 [Cerioporus squamosus]|nr:hypothetical protein C8T65DRAFT_709474 [Cerioporus squamosus]
MLYSHLSYVVRFQGRTSEDAFSAAAGILIGDPASPILWLLFISDFELPPDPDDIALDGAVVSHQWLADDAMLASTATRAAQAKLDYFEVYCGDNSLTPSVPKTFAALFGPVPSPPPVLTLQRRPLAWVETAVYTGVTVTSSARNIFKLHYVAKEKSARKPLALRPLEQVELAFLRRVLSLGTQCQIAPLYIDTGLWPLRYRRLALALRYLLYILTDGPTHLAAAFRDGYALATRSPAAGGPASSWWSDLYHALASLPVPVYTLPLNAYPETDRVRLCLTDLQHSLFEFFTTTMRSAARLPGFQARLCYRSKPPSSLSELCALRAYLSLSNARLRNTLVRLMCSEHPLAIEVLRRLPEADVVPHRWRACRFCRRRGSIEDEPHFFSTADRLSAVFARVRRQWGGWKLLDFILHSDVLLRPCAEYIHAVFLLCESTPVLVLRDLETYCSSTVP